MTTPERNVRGVINGHSYSSAAWWRCPAASAPPLVDSSMAFDDRAESMLTKEFGFTFTSEHGDAAAFGGDRDVVVSWLVSAAGGRQLRPVGKRLLIAAGRAVVFDDDLAVLNADAHDEFAHERFGTFGIGSYLRTRRVWPVADGLWAELAVQTFGLDDRFRASVEAALAPTFLVRLSPAGRVVARGGAG